MLRKQKMLKTKSLEEAEEQACVETIKSMSKDELVDLVFKLRRELKYVYFMESNLLKHAETAVEENKELFKKRPWGRSTLYL